MDGPMMLRPALTVMLAPAGWLQESGHQAHFPNLAAALEAARDGDVITLLPGTHLTGQLILVVSKRVAIRAGSSSSRGQVVLDHR